MKLPVISEIVASQHGQIQDLSRNEKKEAAQ